MLYRRQAEGINTEAMMSHPDAAQMAYWPRTPLELVEIASESPLGILEPSMTLLDPF